MKGLDLVMSATAGFLLGLFLGAAWVALVVIRRTNSDLPLRQQLKDRIPSKIVWKD